MQLPTEIEHYKSDIEDHEYQIKRYQRFNLKPNRENMGSVSKSRFVALTPLDFTALYDMVAITLWTLKHVVLLFLLRKTNHSITILN